MGFICSKTLSRHLSSSEWELEELRCCLVFLLKDLTPEDLLIFAIEDSEIHELCKQIPDLRRACILAALRRYHTEKFFYEEVHNRTADYMVLLDNFVQIQDEEDMREMELQKKTDDAKAKSCFSWLSRRRRDRDGDAGASTSAASN